MVSTNEHIALFDILVFLSPTAVTKFRWEPPWRGVKYTWWKNSQFSTEVAVYLENGARLTHRHYESLTGSHR